MALVDVRVTITDNVMGPHSTYATAAAAAAAKQRRQTVSIPRADLAIDSANYGPLIWRAVLYSVGRCDVISTCPQLWTAYTPQDCAMASPGTIC